MSPEALARLPIILFAALATAVVSFLLTPLAIRLAPRLGAVDHPQDDRRVHQNPIPRTGGLAVAAAFVGVGVVGLALNEAFHFAVLREVRYPQVVALFLGAGLGAFLGYLDDRLQLRARWQLVSQLVLAAVAISAGIVIDSIVNPFGSSPIQIGGWLVINIGQQSLDIGLIAVMTLWVVGMINSVNFIDGLDGLLAGVARSPRSRWASMPCCPCRRSRRWR